MGIPVAQTEISVAQMVYKSEAKKIKQFKYTKDLKVQWPVILSFSGKTI